MKAGKLLVWIFFIALLACVLLLFYRASVATMMNSDGHWLGTLVVNFSAGPDEKLYLPGHTFLVKLPFVILVYKLLGNNQMSFHIVNVANDLTWFLICILVILHFNRLNGSAITRIAMFAAIVVSSDAFFVDTGMATVRQSEYGFAFVLFLLCARYLAGSGGPGTRSTTISSLGVIAVFGFALTLSDELFLAAYVLPVLLLVLVVSVRFSDGEIRFRCARRSVALALAVAVSALCATLILRSIGNMSNARLAIAGNASFRLNTFEGLVKSLGITTRAVIDYLGGDIWGKTPSPSVLLQLLTLSMGLCGLTLGVHYLFSRAAQAGSDITDNGGDLERQHFLFLLCGSLAFLLATYTITSFSQQEMTNRYVAATPIVVALFTSLYFEGGRLKRHWKWVLPLCIVILVANTYRLSSELKSRAPNMSYYNALSKIITDSNLKVGLAGYWNASSTAFLTEADDLIIPALDCDGWRYAGVESFFSRTPDFLLVDRNGENKRAWEGCSDEQLAERYGAPKRTYVLKKGADTVEVRVLK